MRTDLVGGVFHNLALDTDPLWKDPAAVWRRYGKDEGRYYGDGTLRINGQEYHWRTNHENIFRQPEAEHEIKDIVPWFRYRFKDPLEISTERAWQIEVDYLLPRFIGPPRRISSGQFLDSQIGVFEPEGMPFRQSDYRNANAGNHRVRDLGELLKPRLLPCYLGAMYWPVPTPSIGLPPMTAEECVRWFPRPSKG